MADLLAKSIRIEFRNMCAGVYLGVISDAFESEHFVPDLRYAPNVSGKRRTLVERYHHSIRWDDYRQVTRVLRVYSRILRTDGRDVFAPDREWTRGAERLIEELTRHNFRVADNGEISFPLGMLDRGVSLDSYGSLTDPQHVQRRIDRMEDAIDRDPDAAIGEAKELVEAVCHTILEDAGQAPDKHLDIPSLYKQTAKMLNLDTESVPESAKGSQAAHKVLRSLATAVQGMAELRNEIGTGHGRTRRSPAQPRHARLAVGSAKTLAVFLLATWETRQRGD